jgi:hypothetical protein
METKITTAVAQMGFLALEINSGIKFQLFRVQAYNVLIHSLDTK